MDTKLSAAQATINNAEIEVQFAELPASDAQLAKDTKVELARKRKKQQTDFDAEYATLMKSANANVAVANKMQKSMAAAYQALKAAVRSQADIRNQQEQIRKAAIAAKEKYDAIDTSKLTDIADVLHEAPLDVDRVLIDRHDFKFLNHPDHIQTDA